MPTGTSPTFQELGRVIRAITLLRFLADAQPRDQITAITNKAEAFHGFSAWLRFGGEAIGLNDPGYQEKIVKSNELLANCVIYSNACDITAAANALPPRGTRSTPTTWPRCPRTSPMPSAASATGCWTCHRRTRTRVMAGCHILAPRTHDQR